MKRMQSANHLCHSKIHFKDYRTYFLSHRTTNESVSTSHYFTKIHVQTPNIKRWNNKNRNGLIQFSVCENLLSHDLLIDKLNIIQKQIEITSETLLYSSSKYYKPLQQSTSNFIHKYIPKQYKLNAKHLIITS
eukprot:518651_1